MGPIQVRDAAVIAAVVVMERAHQIMIALPQTCEPLFNICNECFKKAKNEMPPSTYSFSGAMSSCIEECTEHSQCIDRLPYYILIITSIAVIFFASWRGLDHARYVITGPLIRH